MSSPALARRAVAILIMGMRYLGRSIPFHSTSSSARALQRRADAARDAQQFQLAAALYAEAVALTPGRPRLHVQCGHMLKESGDLAGAEHHYALADRLLPDDADITLQRGHFYKVAMRPDEAEAAYARALELRPGWDQAAEELGRIRGTMPKGGWEGGDAQSNWIVPELLPRHSRDVSGIRRDRLQVLHLAPRRMRGPDGMMKMLSGIEAIRGYCISSRGLTAMLLVLNDEEIAKLPLQGLHLDDGSGRQKFVFNLWHDFSHVPPGRYRLDLRMMEDRTTVRTHRDHVLVAAPAEDDAELLSSDAYIPSPILPQDDDLTSRINTAPSVIRAACRTNLPWPVRTILVQRADQLGDLACSIAAIRRLRELFPEARLVGLLTPANRGLAETFNLFDLIIETELAEDPIDGRRTLGITGQNQLRTRLAQLSIDVALDLAEVSETRPLLLLSGAKFLYGFKAREWPWLSAGFELGGRDIVNQHENIPTSRKLLAMVEALGAMAQENTQVLQPIRSPPLLPAWQKIGQQSYAVFHIGARLPFSRWSGFAELSQKLLAGTDLNIVVVGGGCRALAVQPPSPRIHFIDEILPFEQFQNLLACAAVFVGNDSGPKHLAALLGTPVVSIHMARLNWAEWGQEGVGAIISRRVPCAGCGVHRHPEECGKNFACIRGVTADEVYGEVLRWMAPTRRQRLST